MTDGPLRPGTELGGRYRLEERVDVGSIPEAWRATRTGTEQEVTCFVLTVERFGAAALQRVLTEGPFFQEARHARVVGVLDLGAAAMGAYAISGWFGTDILSTRLARGGAMNRHAGVPLVVDVLNALNALHSRGLVHRSVTPRDILLTIGEDGGLRARLLASAALRALAVDGAPKVSKRAVDPDSFVRWLSPEQLRGGPATAESDVWSVGLLLHTVLTGEHPFQGETDADVCAAMVDGEPTLSPRLSPELSALITRCLSKRPGGRFPDADALRSTLERTVALDDPLGPRNSSRAPQRSTVRPPSVTEISDDFDLDALISDVRASAAAIDSDTLDRASNGTLDEPRPTVIEGSLPAPPAGVTTPPAPSGASTVDSFDLDSLPPPPTVALAPQSLTPRASVQPSAPSLSLSRDSVMHTALEGNVIDRTHAPRVVRTRPISTAVALLGVVAVTAGLGYVGWEFTHPSVSPRIVRDSLDSPLSTVAPTGADVPAGADAEAPVALPRPEMQTPVDFGEQVRIPLPEGLSGQTLAAFVHHLTTPALSDVSTVKGLVSCTEGRVFLHPGGVDQQLRAIAAPVRCESQDIALVPDLDGDSAGDVVAVDSTRTGLVIVGSKRSRVLRRMPLPGAWGIASGLRFGQGTHAEPGVVVFVSAENGTPALVALGLRSHTVQWRSDVSVRPAEPRDYGLSVGPDADGDSLADVVVGSLRDGRRCAVLLSGATGLARWPAPRCFDDVSTQSLTLGPDADDDDRGDVVVGASGDGHVRVLSGRDGRELRVISPDGPGDDQLFGYGVVAAPDLDHGGFTDVVLVRATQPSPSMEVYSANDGHRVGRRSLHADGVAMTVNQTRVQFARDFAFRGSVSVAVATPAEVLILGAAPRPEGPGQAHGGI